MISRISVRDLPTWQLAQLPAGLLASFAGWPDTSWVCLA